MNRQHLLDALEVALGTATGDGFRHHSPPAGPQVVTAKSLSKQGVHHLRHFRHLKHEELAGTDHAPIDLRSRDAVANNECAAEPEVYLLQEKGGEGGESLKTPPLSMACVSPPACGAVANGGEGGESRPSGPALLAQLAEGLQLRHSPSIGSPPVSRAARRHDQLNRWLSGHPPAPCPPDRCAHCGGSIGERAKDAVPVLRSLRPAEPIWLHLDCGRDWYDHRLAAADAALLEGAVAKVEPNGHGDGQ